MNPDLAKLQTYPFEKLAALKAATSEPSSASNHIAFSIGEPKHQPPSLVMDTLRQSLNKISAYPATKGIPELRQAISRWLEMRFKIPTNSVDSETQVLPVNGTREALFAFAQAVIDRSKPDALVVSPNPFYQIYEGATYLSGADIFYLNCTADNNYLPDFDDVDASVWQRCQLIYLCSPGNPSGAVIGQQQMQKLIELADQYDFIIASDECYSELYFDEDAPPTGLLEVCSSMGRSDFSRCVVFHSLSKRSNLPGLRSGFIAGDADILRQFLLYRTYHGCAMSLPFQLASATAWQDEQHVIENRKLYKQKFNDVIDILSPVIDVKWPQASFYLWLATPMDDQLFAQQLYSQENVTVLPGSYIARDTATGNPGKNHVRIALVATREECIEGAQRIRHFLEGLKN
ncbi:succinyldiaminopimelate transaminase [Aurantivibrio plasticivorans]